MAKKKETVTRVIDGDTFLTASRKYPLKLACYNAPEKGTKAGKEATRRLQKLIQGKKVTIEIVGREPYGKALVANVRVGNKSVDKAVTKK